MQLVKDSVECALLQRKSYTIDEQILGGSMWSMNLFRTDFFVTIVAFLTKLYLVWEERKGRSMNNERKNLGRTQQAVFRSQLWDGRKDVLCRNESACKGQLNHSHSRVWGYQVLRWQERSLMVVFNPPKMDIYIYTISFLFAYSYCT